MPIIALRKPGPVLAEVALIQRQSHLAALSFPLTPSLPPPKVKMPRTILFIPLSSHLTTQDKPKDDTVIPSLPCQFLPYQKLKLLPFNLNSQPSLVPSTKHFFRRDITL